MRSWHRQTVRVDWSVGYGPYIVGPVKILRARDLRVSNLHWMTGMADSSAVAGISIPLQRSVGTAHYGPNSQRPKLPGMVGKGRAHSSITTERGANITAHKEHRQSHAPSNNGVDSRGSIPPFAISANQGGVRQARRRGSIGQNPSGLSTSRSSHGAGGGTPRNPHMNFKERDSRMDPNAALTVSSKMAQDHRCHNGKLMMIGTGTSSLVGLLPKVYFVCLLSLVYSPVFVEMDG